MVSGCRGTPRQARIKAANKRHTGRRLGCLQARILKVPKARSWTYSSAERSEVTARVKKHMAIVALAAIATLGTACGAGSSGHPVAHPTPTPTLSTPTSSLTVLAQRYLDVSTPYVAADVQFDDFLNNLDPNNADAAAQMDAARFPYAAALKAFDTALMGLSWPASIQPDAGALESAHATLLADLSMAVNKANFRTWTLTMLNDRTTAAHAWAKLNTDVGLPPP